MRPHTAAPGLASTEHHQRRSSAKNVWPANSYFAENEKRGTLVLFGLRAKKKNVCKKLKTEVTYSPSLVFEIVQRKTK